MKINPEKLVSRSSWCGPNTSPQSPAKRRRGGTIILIMMGIPPNHLSISDDPRSPFRPTRLSSQDWDRRPTTGGRGSALRTTGQFYFTWIKERRTPRRYGEKARVSAHQRAETPTAELRRRHKRTLLSSQIAVTMVDDEATPNRTRPISARAISSNANESVAPHSTRPTPPARGGSRPRTPASVSAVRDGRSLLATFRQNKRRDDEGGGSHDTAVPTHTNGSHRPSAVKPTAGQSTIDYVERYASNAPGLARNLEAALDASLANRRNSDEIGRSNSHAAAVNGGPNGDAAGPSGGELRTQHGEESSDGAASIATATAAAAAAAGVPATEPSPPRKDAISSSSDESPARPTPEVRGAASLDFLFYIRVFGCDFEQGF